MRRSQAGSCQAGGRKRARRLRAPPRGEGVRRGPRGHILKYFQCVPLLVDWPKFPIIVKPMDVELDNLEEKIGQFVALCHHLRAENTQLRQQLAAAINENKQLVGKIAESRKRLEGLLERIPEE